MKVQTNTVINDFYGKPMEILTEDETKKPETMTLSWVASEALLMEERDLAWKEKLDRYRIATKFRRPEVNLTAEEVTLIEKQIAKRFPPVIVGAAAAILEPEVPVEEAV